MPFKTSLFISGDHTLFLVVWCDYVDPSVQSSQIRQGTGCLHLPVSQGMDGKNLQSGLVSVHSFPPSLTDGCSVLQNHLHIVVQTCWPK